MAGDPGRKARVVLCILDGFGWREDTTDNAVRLAHTPVFDALYNSFPTGFLRTDGQEVGLPEGQFGNSEVGHLNLGAGRVVMQDLPRIDAAIEAGLGQLEPVRNFIRSAKDGGGRVHLLGLLSPGGVHAHQRHLVAVARLLVTEGLRVVVHWILDGRDTPPRGSSGYWPEAEEQLKDLPGLRYGTVSGRYYAMDRDKRWERTELAYRALVNGEGPVAESVSAVIAQAHARDIGDEFVKPHVIEGYQGVGSGDSLFCVNFRADRARQLMAALTLSDFDGFDRPVPAQWAAKAGMNRYSALLDKVLDAWVPTPPLDDLLGDVLAASGLRQLRMAETEKYPHVTFFFNGGREEPASGEERSMTPSPKVATYDLMPEMSAGALTDDFVDKVNASAPDFTLINFANPDMVGHTGDLDAAIKAVETVDTCLGRVVEAARNIGATVLVTADHGNCELMRDPVSGGPHTAHTTNPVPIIMVDGPAGTQLRDGRLADVAPTVLALLHLHQPEAMTGKPLLVEQDAKAID